MEPVDGARVSSWLPAIEAAARGQHAARASPSDASSLMQQPQTLRERELAEAAQAQLAGLQKQNAALKKELEKANAAPQVQDDITMKKATDKQLSRVVYYLGSIDRYNDTIVFSAIVFSTTTLSGKYENDGLRQQSDLVLVNSGFLRPFRNSAQQLQRQRRPVRSVLGIG